MHQVHPTAQQVPGGAHVLGVGVGHGQHPPAKKSCDLLGIDLVVLRLGPVDGFHIQRVAEHEGNAFPATQIGDPVPGEDAFHRHDDIAAVGRDGSQEGIGLRGKILVQ